MVSGFQRPKIVSAEQPPAVVQELVGYDPMVRGDVSLGIPIRNNHGLSLGVDLQKVFSTRKIVLDSQAPPETKPDSVVFDMFLTMNVAYQAWF